MAIQDILASYFTPRGGMAGFQKWVQQRRARQQQAPQGGAGPGAGGEGLIQHMGPGSGLAGLPPSGSSLPLNPGNPFNGAPPGTMGNPTAGAPPAARKASPHEQPPSMQTFAGGPIGGPGQGPPTPGIGSSSFQPQEGAIGAFQPPQGYGALGDRLRSRMKGGSHQRPVPRNFGSWSGSAPDNPFGGSNAQAQA